MKKVLFYSACAVICLLTACTKATEQSAQEEQPVFTQEDCTFITANGNELAATKASVDDEAAFTWNTYDRIAVYSGSKYYQSHILAEDYNNTNDATFEFSGNINAGRQDFAIFPSSLVFNGSTVYENSAAEHNAECLTLNLPGEYNLSQLANAKVPVPMIAANAPDGSLAFKNLCALLRFQVTNVPKQTSYITFCFNGNKVQGCFSLTDVVPGESAIETEDTEDEDVIRVNNNGYFSSFQKALIINIPVPVGTYTDVTITTYDSDNHKINAITTPINPSTNWVAGRKSARKRMAALPVFTVYKNVGVTANKKVVFAPGNLQAVLAEKPAADKPGCASSWQFAEHQYTAIGDYTPEGRSNSVNSLQSPQIGDVIDLFSWIGSSASFFNDGDYTDDKYKFGIIYPTGSALSTITGDTLGDSILLDWGQNEISDGVGGTYPAGTWRVLNTEEWTRVIITRKTIESGNPLIDHFAKAQLTSDGETVVARGLILLPDDYTHPAGVPALTNVFTQGNTNTPKTVYCEVNSYTLEQWDKMEAAGCVFFPLTNVRTKATASVTTAPADGAYWSSVSQTGNNNGAVFVFKGLANGSTLGKNFQVGASCARKNGCAVRLVRDVN